MNNTCKIIVAALMLGVSARMTPAQPADGPPPDGQRPPPSEGGPPGGPGPRRHRPPPLPIIAVLDTNHDGIIDANEIAQASESLKKLDKNGDGQLTPDEYMPPLPGTPGGPPALEGQPPSPDGTGPNGLGGGSTNHPPVPLIVAALDLNGDGIIDANEIAQAAESLKKLDKNGDGKLTPDEFHPRHPGGPGGPGATGRRAPGQGPGEYGGQGDHPRPGGPPPDDGGNSPPPAPPGDQKD
jgi:hypothetical protein